MKQGRHNWNCHLQKQRSALGIFQWIFSKSKNTGLTNNCYHFCPDILQGNLRTKLHVHTFYLVSVLADAKRSFTQIVPHSKHTYVSSYFLGHFRNVMLNTINIMIKIYCPMLHLRGRLHAYAKLIRYLIYWFINALVICDLLHTKKQEYKVYKISRLTYFLTVALPTLQTVLVYRHNSYTAITRLVTRYFM